MRVSVVGAGGVGGMLAVRLAAAGTPVGVIARGAHLAAMQDGPLVLQTPEETVEAPATAAADGAALVAAMGTPGPEDIVVFAVKGQDLDGAMEAAAPLMAGGAPVLPFLNGVEATARLDARYGSGRSLIGIARIGAHIGTPGRIMQTTPRASYVIGLPDGSQDGAAAAVRRCFQNAGITVPDCEDVRLELWRKFSMLAPFAGTTAGARTDAVGVCATPALLDLYRALSEEVVALAAAEGVALPADTTEQGISMIGRFQPGVRSSMSHDLDVGKPIELDWLNGAVVRLSAAHGLAAPANAAVAALLTPFRDGPPKAA
ncbi:MAG: 2-dehydropantoate 2-reductase [Pseudomonadota bacterium]